MKKYIEKLHFITHDIEHLSHIEQVQGACEAGAKWIQYRCLTKDDAELLTDIHQIAEICDDWGATLIVTDHIHLKGRQTFRVFTLKIWMPTSVNLGNNLEKKSLLVALLTQLRAWFAWRRRVQIMLDLGRLK